MLRKLTLSLSALVAGSGLLVSTASLAATVGSPSVTAVQAHSIKDTSAVLSGDINPNRSQTNYYFQFGLTTAYGSSSTSHSAGGGSKSVGVSTAAVGLLPGTTYHFRLVASNVHGQTIGVDRTLKTTGPPPPTAQTGAATGIGRNSATLTGVIDPNNATTSYYFQYGPSPFLGTNTSAATVPKGVAPVAVSRQITALQPGVTFYYRIVAFHGSIVTYGATGMFLSEPFPRFASTLKVSTQPSRVKRSPYKLTTFGQLSSSKPNAVPAALGCTGRVRVRLWKGKKRVSQVYATVQPNCSFSVTNQLNRLPGRGGRHRKVRLKVLTFFEGNGYLAPKTGQVEHVTLGRG